MPIHDYPPGTNLGLADDRLVAEFGRWLATNADLRPFVWVHLLRPHWPYTPPLSYLPDSLRDRMVPADVAYTAEVREADDLVAGLLAAIDSTVGLEHSLIVLTSDHGEEFGEHGMGEHGHSLHGEVVHVPLILSGPSLRAGTTVRGYASTLDLLPTLLDLVGASARAPKDVEGTSLLPLIRSDEESRTIHVEGMLYGSTKRAVVQNGYKLLFDAQGQPTHALFDLAADPLESRNLITAQPARAAAMQKLLAAHSARVVEDYAAFIGPAAIQSNQETQRILRAMRTLGYVND